ncbi:hypothetical protein ABPG72_013388 [Tetrahymena utriculariae]
MKKRKDCKTILSRSYYLVGAICFIGLQYYLFVFQFMRDRFQFYQESTVVILFFFHVLFFLLLWSMFQSITSDPGKVPLYWGVIMDDPETKKRRYCLICHQFKPERSHHCSTCERCVLNMDHHCPWIMNCIGFHNRKFFILMVFYISLTVIYLISFELLFAIDIIRFYWNDFTLPNLIFKGLAIIVTLLFASVIINFFHFHIQLLLHNTTTIETMEKQKNEQQGQPVQKENPFDYGYKYNWYQVFGLNPYLWFFPIFAQSGKPLGDGVTWDRFPMQYYIQDHNPNMVTLQQRQNNSSTIISNNI